jgi:hypothetical protein|tara:strand:- start:807 stop:1502 length:696 start_codon:yes stop_codon:yes gene_type:complete
MKKKRRKRGTGKQYFTKDTENAIVAYTLTEDNEIRTKLYVKEIKPALDELVDKIVYTYKFTSLSNIDVLKDDCKVWLTTILAKYDQSKGTKAFSYFSVVTKNWFTHQAKQQTKKNKREIEYDSMIREVEVVSAEKDETFIQKQEDAQFWQFLMSEIDSWKDLKLRENERKVLDAIETLFSNIENIDIFNKKAIYLYMREITGLNTKQIVSNLNRLREKYKTFRHNWNNGEV